MSRSERETESEFGKGFQRTLGGMAAGAAVGGMIGTVLLPGIGTATGAEVGAKIGAICSGASDSDGSDGVLSLIA